MRIFGYISEQDSRHSGSRTPFLPGYNFHECHRSALIHARPAELFGAARFLPFSVSSPHPECAFSQSRPSAREKARKLKQKTP